MDLSLCFLTGRADPHLDWALDGLASQCTPSDRFDLIIVDSRAATDPTRHTLAERERVLVERLRGACRDVEVRIVAPKPTIWQGPHRVTSCEWWATANARNTALVLARYPHMAFLDDRCRLGPLWLDTVREGTFDNTAVVCGSYDKIEGDPENPAMAHDHRRGIAPNGKPDCGGGWLYGCTFALPLAWALEVNGFEEGCDGLTGEDYIFGLMLANRGHRIDFEPLLYVLQDRTRGNETCKGLFASRDKGTSPNDKSHAALERFGTRKRTEFTPDLVDLRERYARGEGFPLPSTPPDGHRDWFDGQLISEMERVL